jgi:low affinity Fe/Cu permease
MGYGLVYASGEAHLAAPACMDAKNYLITMAKKKKESPFERMAASVTRFSGGTPAFMIALGTIVVWVITGPVFDYSDTWQLVINTGTTIITFLMVFLIQRAQNKDSRAVHLKLNELVASLKGPSNRLVDVEHLSEQELNTLSRYYAKLASMAAEEKDLTGSHSIEEAEESHHGKYPASRKGKR